MKTISNSELHKRTVEAVASERRATHEVIELLKENRARRLYAEMGYPSLFEYLTKALGYSESAAYERYNTCMLATRVPEVSEKIQSGELSLSVASRLASHVKRESPTLQETKALTLELTGCSVREA